MPEFELVKSLNRAQFRAVRELYIAMGWWYQEDDKDEDRLERIISGSQFFCLALESDIVVGMGRAIGDGISDAYIQDVAVREDHRRKGIATGVIRRLVQALRNSHYTWIGLISTPHALTLYRKIGFEELKGNIPMHFKDRET